jgi:histidyl-tRNA synthetase
MAKPKKTPRPKASTPRGFQDYFGADVRRRDEMLRAIAEVYHLHGFDPLETSAVETVESLGKFLPDVDRPNAGVFAFQEDGAEDATWLALRYDLTAPLARVAAQFRQDLPTPYRRYAMGPVWRNEKPGPGRFRQFYQCDADTVGSASPAADAEICAMLAAALEAAQIPRGGYVIKLNDRLVLDGVLDEALGEGVIEGRDAILRSIDKYDKFGAEGVRLLLQGGRRDESGDFTEGCGLTDPQADHVIRFLQARRGTDEETLDELGALVGGSPAGAQGVSELRAILGHLRAAGIGPDRARVDPSIVRGLGYYTGPVFEAELTHEVTGEDGRPRAFGSIAGGGRYDGLVERFTGQKVPATGISIGVDRLLAALDAMGAAPEAPGPVVVTVMDRGRMDDYAAVAAELRAAGIRAEIYLGNPKNFGNQLKYADKRGSPAAIIEGADEAARGVVQVKDLALGAEIARTATHEEWRGQPAQREVPRDGLVAAIREILAR